MILNRIAEGALYIALGSALASLFIHGGIVDASFIGQGIHAAIACFFGTLLAGSNIRFYRNVPPIDSLNQNDLNLVINAYVTPIGRFGQWFDTIAYTALGVIYYTQGPAMLLPAIVLTAVGITNIMLATRYYTMVRDWYGEKK